MDANDWLYLRARYYSPALGVFTALDPVENFNRYQYVDGNPTNAADPTGMFAWGSSVTERGDYCYCIGREAGIPDSHLENFAIWLKNNNPTDAFMPDTATRRYWLYPGKSLTIPDSFEGFGNIPEIGLWKRNGCHCPASVNSGRCNVANNPIQLPSVDNCQCPEGQLWNPFFQQCVRSCPTGFGRLLSEGPEGLCYSIGALSSTQQEPTAGGQVTPTPPRDCNPLRSLNPRIYGMVMDVSFYMGGGGGFSAYAMTDGNEIALYLGAEAGGGFSGDVLPFLEVILTPVIKGLIGGDEPWNIYSEADLDSFAGTMSETIHLENLAVGGRITKGDDVARYISPDCIFTDVRGYDAAVSVTVSISTVWEIKRVRIPRFP